MQNSRQKFCSYKKKCHLWKNWNIMLDVVKVASYISRRYEREYGSPIDEMKLHKLLYFAQRESLIQLDQPLFATAFQAWKYGPVLVQIRSLYKQGKLTQRVTFEEIAPYRTVFDKVFEQYAPKDAWSLSSITHGEISWQKARVGIPAGENSDALIDLDDIRKDAHQIKLRRYFLSHIQTVR